ncbi:unnamed protein product [Polarella glacialis]|uniref:Uncharacterized protein n=1 Tax=Polarella glacialis TaxID=89957 RepID=A0A813DIU2_POLGL|nr:unnamed protein product [Polarella glacialis]
MQTAAHAPLKCRFTAEASKSSDRLELCSLWACVVKVPKGLATFEGAFIHDNAILSWAGNNSAKYPPSGGHDQDVWTLISTPEYGSANKCPQEAIPDHVRRKVSDEMCRAFGKLLRGASTSWEVVHLQLWGAANPLNVCNQHFVHDPQHQVGICGDWLTSPSVEGALFSGLALAAALERELRGGGLGGTGARRFQGLTGGHAIGNFGGADGLSVAAAVEAATRSGGKGQDHGNSEGKGKGMGKAREEGAYPAAGGAAKRPLVERPVIKPAQAAASVAEPSWPDLQVAATSKSRWRRTENVGVPVTTLPSNSYRSTAPCPGPASAAEGPKWYFGFGANINPWKLREQRQILPLEEFVGKLPGWKLVFNHKGGFGNIEPLSALISHGASSPDAVHGVLLLLKAKDFDKLAKMEHEYGTREVLVETYDGRSIAALAFITPPQFKLSASLAPTPRYLKLIRDGCDSMGIDPAYRSWLQTVSSTPSERGSEYYAVQGSAGQKLKKQQSEGDPELLHLAAVASFAVAGDTPLVDIGANLGKCSAPELAAQLVRASAARVGHVILTGCSIKSSKDAKRMCEEWNGEKGVQKALSYLGVASRKELDAAGIQRLPTLAFTAGVHPHDAKSCDGNTISTLRLLAEHPSCVAIGECGLDYDRMFTPREVQLEWCRKQVELAIELDMPLFMHERDRDAVKGAPLGSAGDLRKIIFESEIDPSKVCIHCFTGSDKDLKEYISRGYQIGLTGFAAMHKRGAHIRRFLEAGDLPLHHLMIETDCPFMLPDKQYLPDSLGIKARTNEPCCMPAVCRAVAECFRVAPEEVARQTTENAARFFGL